MTQIYIFMKNTHIYKFAMTTTQKHNSFETEFPTSFKEQDHDKHNCSSGKDCKNSITIPAIAP